jgi:NAD(P)-dependent dehydrogenase (short-subunit alcohol dehydrogenase family)
MMREEIAGLFDLTGRFAVVTGSATGIGEGIARVLAAAGATVAVADIDVEGAERVATDIGGVDGWFQRPSFEGCFFINALLEVEDPDEGIHAASREQLARIRSFVEELARSAGIADPQSVAHQWHILMKGSIVAAQEGDRQAAKRAQAMGRLLLDSLLPAP